MEDVYYHKIKVVINVDVMNHEKNELEIDKTSCMRVCDGHTYIKEEIRGHASNSLTEIVYSLVNRDNLKLTRYE